MDGASLQDGGWSRYATPEFCIDPGSNAHAKLLSFSSVHFGNGVDSGRFCRSSVPLTQVFKHCKPRPMESKSKTPLEETRELGPSSMKQIVFHRQKPTLPCPRILQRHRNQGTSTRISSSARPLAIFASNLKTSAVQREARTTNHGHLGQQYG